MRRDSLRLFELIQLQGSIAVLDVQIIVGVIVNEIQTASGALAARLVSIGYSEYNKVLFPTHLAYSLVMWLLSSCTCKMRTMG